VFREIAFGGDEDTELVDPCYIVERTQKGFRCRKCVQACGSRGLLAVFELAARFEVSRTIVRWLSSIAEAAQSGAMPLRLRRAANQFPRARWEPSNEHLVHYERRDCCWIAHAAN
jgi:hypothetical protein